MTIPAAIVTNCAHNHRKVAAQNDNNSNNATVMISFYIGIQAAFMIFSDRRHARLAIQAIADFIFVEFESNGLSQQTRQLTTPKILTSKILLQRPCDNRNLLALPVWDLDKEYQQN